MNVSAGPRRRPAVSLTLKILLPVVVLFVGFSLGLGTWISVQTRKSLFAAAAAQTAALRSASRELLAEELENFAGRFEDPLVVLDLAPSLARGMVDQARTSLKNLARSARAHYACALTEQGQLLATSTGRPTLRPPAELAALFQRLRAQPTNTRGFVVLPQAAAEFMGLDSLAPTGPAGELLAMLVAVRIEDDFGDPTGSLLGLQVVNGNQALARHLGQTLGGAPVSLLHGPLRVATTLGDGRDTAFLGTRSRTHGQHDCAAVTHGTLPPAAQIGAAPFLLGCSPLSDVFGSQVGVLEVALPVSGVYQAARQFRDEVFLAGMAANALFVVLILLVVNHALDAVARIRTHLDAVGTGRLDARVQVDTRDELGALAAGVNHTVSTLSALVGQVGSSFDRVEQATATVSGVTEALEEGTREEKRVHERLGDTADSLFELTDQVSLEAASLNKATQENLAALNHVAAAVGAISRGASDLVGAATESGDDLGTLVDSAAQVAVNTEALSALLQETSAAVLEIDGSIRAIKDLAGQTEEVAAALAIETEQSGQKSVATARAEIGRVEGLVGELGATIGRVGAHSQEIGEIVGLISEVAEQTDLLALNAAILASQAGSQGKGFAVVADEIRNLSERTETSLREIEKRVDSIQQESARAVAQVERGLAAVSTGVQSVLSVARVFDGIIESAAKTRRYTGDIAAQTRIQADNSSVVAASVEEISSQGVGLSTAANQQRETSLRVREAAEGMRARAVQMADLAREQGAGVQQIRGQVEQTFESADRLTQTAGHARDAGTGVKSSLASMQQMLAESGQRISRLDEAVAGLLAASSAARDSLARFQLRGSAARPQSGTGAES